MIEFLESVGNCLMGIARHDDYFNMYFYISQADIAKVSKSIKYVLLRPLFFTFVAKKNLRFLLNNKVQRSSGAKHCSSLCSQSEGGRILWRLNTAKNPTKSCPRALVMFATCSWPSLCEQSELQCWRRNRRFQHSRRSLSILASAPFRGAGVSLQIAQSPFA